MRVVPVEEPQKYGEVVGVTEQPAPASGVVVGVLTEQPAPVSGVVVGVVTEQPGASSGGAARGVVDQTLAMLDGLLSTEEISGDYRCCCFPFVSQSMSVVPLGADAIETWRTCCLYLPPLFIWPVAEGAVRTRKPGTNAFLNPQNPDPNSNLMTFSADGTASGCYKKRRTSQKRAFHKVETRDLAGKWWGCFCFPFMPFWPPLHGFLTTKKALNEDQYAESGGSGYLLTLCLPLIPVSATRTRKYVNGHPTNGFAKDGNSDPNDVHWYRDPGCAGCSLGPLVVFFAKKVG